MILPWIRCPSSHHQQPRIAVLYFRRSINVGILHSGQGMASMTPSKTTMPSATGWRAGEGPFALYYGPTTYAVHIYAHGISEAAKNGTRAMVWCVDRMIDDWMDGLTDPTYISYVRRDFSPGNPETVHQKVKCCATLPKSTLAQKDTDWRCDGHSGA